MGAHVIVIGGESGLLDRLSNDPVSRTISMVNLAEPKPDQAEVIAASSMVLWLNVAEATLERWFVTHPSLLNRLHVVSSEPLAQAVLRFDENAWVAVLSSDWNPKELVVLTQASQRSGRLFVERAKLRELVASRQVDRESQHLLEHARVIAAAKREWEWVFDTIDHPIILIDRNFRVRRANLAFAQEALKPIKDVINKRCHETWFDRATPCNGCPVQKAIETSSEAKGRIESRNRLWEVLAFAGDPATWGGAACSYRDITDDAAQTERMLHNEKMLALGQLAGGVAHEVNNPLSIILAFSQIMLATGGRSEEDVEALNHIEASAKRCKTIVEGMLKFSRRPDFSVGPVDMSACIQSALGLFRVMLKTFPKVRFETKVPADQSLVVSGNSDQLQQVVLNLLTNGLQALPDGQGSLELCLESAKDGVALKIQDTGCGIPPEHLKKIFEPSFTTKPVGVGTGLGLSICRSIIERHGGTISVTSVVGQGTSFEVMLPNQQLLKAAEPGNNAILPTQSQLR